MKNNTNIESREDMEKRFGDEFVCDIDPEEHAFVAFYNEEANKFDFWNAYKITNFITTTRLSDIDALRGICCKDCRDKIDKIKI